MAHVEPSALDEALAALGPGSSVDLRGTTITADLLGRLFEALTPREEHARPVFGIARFNGAHFTKGDAGYRGPHLHGNAWFDEAQFSGTGGFSRAMFSWGGGFSGVRFTGPAWFHGARFDGTARFDSVQFSMMAEFNEARFGGDAWFDRAQFSRNAMFGGARFSGDVGFDEAKFEGFWSGPLVCRSRFSAAGITVARAVRLQVAAAEVFLVGARFAAPAVFSVRYGAVNLTDVAADAPLTVASHPTAFKTWGGAAVDESALGGDARARVMSVAGVNAENLVLADVDLSGCVFVGAHHLDRIRLEGRCVFASAPRGWVRLRGELPVRRWTRRKVLAEEATWRASPAHRTLARAGWSNPGGKSEPVPVPSPAQLAVLYRQLRKALEDGKDTPGASDFYYGEMEARRHDTEGTPRGERALLHAYWLLSGYALRTSRALGFLAATGATTFLLMMVVGLPDNQLDPQITGPVPAAGGQVALTQATPDPALTLPLGRRFTAQRADKASLVVVNSVIFRSTGTTLTGPGTWIEIISRIGEPVLLGFAAVAARGRVQR